MTFVEKQMAVQLLSRRDWTWPEIFQFLELVTQKPLESDERKSLQDRDEEIVPKAKKTFHNKQPIMLIAIADTVFDQVNLEPDFFASEDEYLKCRNAFRQHFEQHAELMAQKDEWFRNLVTSDATRARDMLHIEARTTLKDWWEKAGYRVSRKPGL